MGLKSVLSDLQIAKVHTFHGNQCYWCLLLINLQIKNNLFGCLLTGYFYLEKARQNRKWRWFCTWQEKCWTKSKRSRAKGFKTKWRRNRGVVRWYRWNRRDVWTRDRGGSFAFLVIWCWSSRQWWIGLYSPRTQCQESCGNQTYDISVLCSIYFIYFYFSMNKAAIIAVIWHRS